MVPIFVQAKLFLAQIWSVWIDPRFGILVYRPKSGRVPNFVPVPMYWGQLQSNTPFSRQNGNRRNPEVRHRFFLRLTLRPHSSSRNETERTVTVAHLHLAFVDIKQTHICEINYAKKMCFACEILVFPLFEI